MRRIRHNRGKQGEAGYILLLLMLFVALLAIAMIAAAPNYKRAIQRDREIEMIHRGEQYERAVKRFYKKFGRYPTRIEDLENTNNVRFLRKRYKDPMNPEGGWKLVHQGDVKLGNASNGLAMSANQPTGLQPSQPAFGGSSSGGSSIFGNSIFSNSSNTNSNAPGGRGAPTETNQPSDDKTSATAAGTDTSNENVQTTESSSGSTLGTSAFNTQTTAGGSNQPMGGGPILGVVSLNKSEGIHEFGDKKKYSEWFFIYDSAQDRGQLLRGPYNPNAYFGKATNSATGQTSATGTQQSGQQSTQQPTQDVGSPSNPTSSTPQQ